MYLKEDVSHVIVHSIGILEQINVYHVHNLLCIINKQAVVSVQPQDLTSSTTNVYPVNYLTIGTKPDTLVKDALRHSNMIHTRENVSVQPWDHSYKVITVYHVAIQTFGMKIIISVPTVHPLIFIIHKRKNVFVLSSYLMRLMGNV